MSDKHTKFSRRDLLRLAAIGLGGAILAACQRAVEPITAATSTPTKGAVPSAPSATSTPIIGVSASTPPVTPGPTVAAQIPITSNEDFYTVSVGNDPSEIPSDWKFTITGQVDKPLTLTLDQIKAMPSVTEMRSLMCISNPVGGHLTGNAIWKGVRLKDLLAQAGVKAGARYLKLESFDGFSTGIPLDLGMDEHALLVYEMNNEPLPLEHGAPLRCLWPGRYGMKQPKWIQTITVVDTPYSGYWERAGWSDEARIRPFSRIDAPKDLAVISDPTFALSGIAFTDENGLTKLEISWDDSYQWQPADLTRGPSPYVWTVWRWTGNALTPGRHTLYARATDGRGQMQMRAQVVSLLGETFPNGTDEMHSIVLEFRG